MISAATLTNASDRLESRLAEIGVNDVRVEVSGGRSIVETLSGQENAVDVAKRLRADGFTGCWIIAIGTNDAANIAAGAARQADERIFSMMAVIGSDPALWIDAATIVTTGYWASPNIAVWDDALTVAARSYRNLRIAPWSSVVLPGWFVSDGIHLTAGGAAARVQFVAAALAAAFPKT
jgi:lysophospholipase L1-like esterase